MNTRRSFLSTVHIVFDIESDRITGTATKVDSIVNSKASAMHMYSFLIRFVPLFQI